MTPIFQRLVLLIIFLLLNFNILFAQTRQFKIGFFSLFMAAPFIYAEQTDLFKKEGLDVKLYPYANLMEMAKDFHDGKLDAAIFPIPMVFSYRLGLLSDLPAENIKVILVAGANGGSLVVIDPSIKSPKDLKGKTVVSFSKMCPCYPLLRLFLLKNGIDPEKNANHLVFNFDNFIEYILEQKRIAKEIAKYEELKKKNKDDSEIKEKYEKLKDKSKNLPKVSAFLIPEPNTTFIKSLAGGIVMASTRNIWKDHPFGGLVVKDASLKEKKEVIEKIIGVIGRLSLSINLPQNRENLVNILVKTKYNPPEFTYPILKGAFRAGETDYPVFPYKSSAVVWIDLLKTLGMLPEKVDSYKLAEETFASSFTREALKKANVPVPPSDYRAEIIMGEIRNFRR
jgi:ABC-type nitrate/sulfonate/bicarbonate transport system substrate-binding protein